MTEQWSQWKPIEGLSHRYYLDDILDTAEGFKIILSDVLDKKNRVIVNFENSVDAHRNTDESFRRGMISKLHDRYGTKFYSEWCFFKVEDSQYIKWLSEQSCGITDSMKLIHFCFFTIDSVLDVIAPYEPIVEVVNSISKYESEECSKCECKKPK